LNAAGNAAGTNPGVGIANVDNGNSFLNNVVSGNQGGGIYVSGLQNVFKGNLVGTAPDGTTPFGNTGFGLVLSEDTFPAGNTTIGGTAAGEGNTFANTTSAGAGAPGVGIGSDNGTGIGNQIQGNKIVNNAGLGIDLNGTASSTAAGDGPTMNDAQDPDTGPN